MQKPRLCGGGRGPGGRLRLRVPGSQVSGSRLQGRSGPHSPAGSRAPGIQGRGDRPPEEEGRGLGPWAGRTPERGAHRVAWLLRTVGSQGRAVGGGKACVSKGPLSSHVERAGETWVTWRDQPEALVGVGEGGRAGSEADNQGQSEREGEGSGDAAPPSRSPAPGEGREGVRSAPGGGSGGTVDRTPWSLPLGAHGHLPLSRAGPEQWAPPAVQPAAHTWTWPPGLGAQAPGTEGCPGHTEAPGSG